MEKVISVKLGSHFDGFISNLTESGRFSSASEALRAGLRLLERDEQEYQAKLENLRSMLIEGEESGESDRSWKEIIAEARSELKAELNAE